MFTGVGRRAFVCLLVAAFCLPAFAQAGPGARIAIRSAVADAEAGTLVVSGEGFGSAPVVVLDGVPVEPLSSSDTQVILSLPAWVAASPGTYRLQVTNTETRRTDDFEVAFGVSVVASSVEQEAQGRAAAAGGPRVVPDAAIVSALGPGVAQPEAGSGGSGLLEDVGAPYRTGIGYRALAANTSAGGFNSAAGYYALQTNTSGSSNTAAGYYALKANTTGGSNTAMGANALKANTTASNNTAVGTLALAANTTGTSNTAMGERTLYSNVSGTSNTAIGLEALFYNTGSRNTAVGASALIANTSGADNAADGYQALSRNTTGTKNTALGAGALKAIVSGSQNVAIGYNAGSLNTGSNNITIGNLGSNLDSGTIRIGTAGTQTKTFIAGIAGVAPAGTAVAVQVNSSGQLGVAASSLRYKRDVREMGEASHGLLNLRPVTFAYKQDAAAAPRRYGLIAEEVMRVFPDLVAFGENGEVETVLYDQLPSLLLNELQLQQKTIDAQATDLAATRQEVADLRARLADIETLLAGLRLTAAK